MATLEDLEKRIQKIESRNHAVESDKDWETSYSRRFLVAAFTYFTIALYMKFVVGIDPWINAIVPTVGFLLSNLTLPFFKRLWQKFLYR